MCRIKLFFELALFKVSEKRFFSCRVENFSILGLYKSYLKEVFDCNFIALLIQQEIIQNEDLKNMYSVVSYKD